MSEETLSEEFRRLAIMRIMLGDARPSLSHHDADRRDALILATADLFIYYARDRLMVQTNPPLDRDEETLIWDDLSRDGPLQTDEVTLLACVESLRRDLVLENLADV